MYIPKWMAPPKISPKTPEIFLVAFDLYTQPWTKLQNEIQHFVFFRTGYPPPPLRAFFLVSNLYFVLFKNPIILYLSIFCTISAAEEYLVFLKSMMLASRVALVVNRFVAFFSILLFQIMLSVLAMSHTSGSW